MRAPRRAKIRLDLVRLHDLLDLSDAVTVVGVHVQHDPDAVYVYVEAPGLPELPPDTEAPLLTACRTTTTDPILDVVEWLHAGAVVSSVQVWP